MSARSVIIRLEAEVAGYIAGMGRAAAATDNVARQVVNSRRSVDDNSAAMDKAGKAMLSFGAVSMAALGASAKAAMDWESAWAGVTKTVDGTPEQMRALEGSLRSMAKSLPASHQEIAAVAEAAGQLGVKRADIAGFTKTMVDLGVSTNLTADEAATNIAQISNVMGTMKREGAEGVSRFGAALVALGNDGASTEKEILSMAQRIAGAGATVGASEVEVLALSNTLASMGVKAELGGGVTTRVLLKMFAAVKEGGDDLNAFATTAGLTAADFSKKFGESPVQALDLVAKGMAKVKDNGGNVVQTMKDMGIKGTEEYQVMLSLAASGDLLSNSLDLGNKSWKENTALLAEATKRYETTDSKVKIAWNNIKDAAIDAGAALLPIIQGIAEAVTGLAQGFGSLPAPVKAVLTVLTSVVGVGALLGGTMLTVLPKLNDLRTAFQQVDAAGSRIPGTWNKMAKAAAGVMAATAAFEGIKAIHNNMQPGTKSVEDFTGALIGMNSQQDSLDNLFKSIEFGAGDKLTGKINNVGDAMKHLVDQNFDDAAASFGANVLGIDNGMSKLQDAVKKTDQSMAAAVSSGNMELASKGFKAVALSAGAQGVKIEDVAKKFPSYISALKAVGNEAGVQISDQEALAWAMGKVPKSMEEAAAKGGPAADALKNTGGAAEGAVSPTKELSDALDEIGIALDGAVSNGAKFVEFLFKAGLLNLSARDAARNYQEAIDSVTESIAKNGRTLDITTAQGRGNQAALDGIASAGLKVIEANAKNGDSQAQLQGSLTQTYNDLIKGAGQFGITGQAAIDLARDILKVPPGVSIESWMSTVAEDTAKRTRDAMNAIDGKTVNTYVNHHETTFIDTVRSDSGPNSGQGTSHDGERKAYAGGGEIVGPGTSTSDEVLIAASPGEHMFDAGDVAKMGGQQAVYRFRRNLQAGKIPHFAQGGAVPGSSRMTPAVALIRNHQVLAPSGAGTWTGNLYLDSGEFLGRVQGIARQEAGAAVDAAGRDIGRGSSV